jgi:type IV pilus assembly protein PilF
MMEKKWVFFVLFCSSLLSGCVIEPIRPKANKERAIQSYISAGMEYMKLGDMERANRHLSRALEINSRSPEAHNSIALLYQATKDVKLAEKHFKKAIRYGDNYSMAENNYGSFLFSLGRYDDAIEHLSNSANNPIYENRGQAHENLGRCYLALNDEVKAKESFERSIVINSKLSRGYLELADLALKKKDWREAKRNIDRFNDLAKKTSRSLWIGIQIERVLGDKNLLSSYELTLKNLYPDSKEFRLYQESMKNGKSGEN